MCLLSKSNLALTLSFICLGLVAGCERPIQENPSSSNSVTFDALSTHVLYMDSVMEAGNLLLLENYLQQLVKEEPEWSRSMGISENTWMSFWIAFFYTRLGDLPEAKRYIDRASSSLDSVKNEELIAVVINNAAGIEAELGNHNRSIELLVRGMERYRDDTLNAHLIDYYNNIGHNYNISGDYDLAVQYFSKHRALAERLGKEEEFGVYHFNMGDMYRNQGDYKNSIIHLEQAKHYYRQYKRVEDEMHANALQASNYIALGRMEEAEHLLEGNLQQAESGQLWEVYIETAISLFELHLAMGDEREALTAIQEALSKTSITNTAKLQLNIFDRLVDYYTGKGDFKNAFRYLTEKNALRDNVFESNKIDFMREMTIKYEADRKNDEIESLKLENERERRVKTAYLTGMIVLVLVMTLIVVLIRRISVQKKELLLVNATKDRLFSIIAHDLRSPMIALQGMGQLLNYYIEKKDVSKLSELGNQTGETLARVTHLLDNLLNWAVTNSKQIRYQPIKQDAKALVDEALSLHKPAAEARNIRIEARVEPAKVFADTNMASTVLRNLISNAIKFAPSGSVVTVSGVSDTLFYKVSIQDEGGGIPKDVLDRLSQSGEGLVFGGDNGKFGLGLWLATYFAASNHGKLSLRKEGKGTLAVVQLPLAD